MLSKRLTSGCRSAKLEPGAMGALISESSFMSFCSSIIGISCFYKFFFIFKFKKKNSLKKIRKSSYIGQSLIEIVRMAQLKYSVQLVNAINMTIIERQIEAVQNGRLIVEKIALRIQIMSGRCRIVSTRIDNL